MPPDPKPEELVDEQIDESEIEGEQPDPAADEDDALDGDGSGEAVDDGEEDLAGEDEGQAGAADQVKPLPRAQRRVVEAVKAANAAKAEAAELRTRLNALEQAQAGRQTAQQEIEERERVALMSPDERTEFLVKKVEQNFGRQISQLQFQSADSADKTAFDGLCARNKAFAAVQDRVEELLAQERRAGSNPRREVVAKYLIGELAIQRASRAVNKQTKDGQSQIRRQTAKPGGGARSDIGGGQGRTSDKAARAKRLENQQI